jgi:hypothetical protein
MSLLILSFQLVGLIFEIVGVFFMARGLITTQTHNTPSLLLSALVRGKLARGSEWIPSIEKKAISLQGLALIGIGFLIQAIGTTLSILIGLRNG